MAVSAEYAGSLRQQFAPFGHIAIRNMLGGAGVYCDGVIFALIADEELYFKADTVT